MSQQRPKRRRSTRTARRGRASTTCPSGKIRYRDKLEADMALARAKRPAATARRQECRSYFHPPCQGWHLTSKP